jgi:hypothetical protein
VSGRLDEEKLETLRSWGAGLAADERDELRAAGKAILILVEEIDRLQVDVWRTRHDGASATSGTVDDPDVAAEPEAAPPVLESTLRARLRRLLHTDAAP